jgi:hypothetical protein
VSYSYQAQRAEVFTEAGQVMFLKIRDNAKRLLSIAGAAQAEKIWAGCSGDSWTMLACVDRLVELGELRLICREHCPTQNQVYVAGSGFL